MPARARSAIVIVSNDTPFNFIVPATLYPGLPVIIFANVVLPEPFGPTNACISPFAIAIEKSLRIVVSAIETDKFFTSNTYSPVDVNSRPDNWPI